MKYNKASSMSSASSHLIWSLAGGEVAVLSKRIKSSSVCSWKPGTLPFILSMRFERFRLLSTKQVRE